MWWVLVQAAVAAPECAAVDLLIRQAQVAFDDAEVDEARRRIEAAHVALGCQSQVVPREVLLDLYHLDALASMAAEDRRAAQFAIIRSVSVDPDAAPPLDAGPELREVHETWSARLRESVLAISATDGYRVWVDGAAVDMAGLKVVSGEHLVQLERGGTWSSSVLELAAGKPAPAGMLVAALQPRFVAPAAVKPLSEPPPRPPTRIRIGWAAVSSSLMLAGGAALAGGSVMERVFQRNGYADETYGDCSKGDSCWAIAREDLIRKDAARINTMYGAGYGALALGAGILGIEILVSPSGGGLRVRGQW